MHGNTPMMIIQNYKNMIERHFIVIADTECYLIKKTVDANKVAKHLVNACCFYLLCTYDRTKNKWTHVGPCSIVKVLVDVTNAADERIPEMKHNTVMKMTQEDNYGFEHASCCHMCNGSLLKKE